MSRYREISFFMAVGILLLFLLTSALAQNTNPCVDCHQKTEPILVKQYLESQMGKAGIECFKCHGSEHKNATDYKKVKLPNADSCKPCHENRSSNSGRANISSRGLP
jgi:hypothetical protein